MSTQLNILLFESDLGDKREADLKPSSKQPIRRSKTLTEKSEKNGLAFKSSESFRNLADNSSNLDNFGSKSCLGDELKQKQHFASNFKESRHSNQAQLDNSCGESRESISYGPPSCFSDACQ